MNLIADLSQRKALTALRFLYPVWIVVGLFSIMYVPSVLIDSGDAAATASNIANDEWLFRLGIVGSLLTQIIQILAVLLLYKLFKPVNKNHAGLMVVFALVGVPIAMLSTLNLLAVLLLLNGADYLQSFTVDQLNSNMMFFIDLHEQGVFIATIFWGLWLLPLGYLIYKSGYLPRIIGVLVFIGGLGYLLDPMTRFILTDFGSYEDVLVPAFSIMTIGEVLFGLWLIFRGAKIPHVEPAD